MNPVLAQEIKLPGITGPAIRGPLYKINTLADVITAVMSFVLPMAGILLFFYLVWGGFNFMLSDGEPEKIQAGKDKIKAALTGFFILIMSLLIVRLFSFIFKLGGGLF